MFCIKSKLDVLLKENPSFNQFLGAQAKRGASNSLNTWEEEEEEEEKEEEEGDSL